MFRELLLKHTVEKISAFDLIKIHPHGKKVWKQVLMESRTIRPWVPDGIRRRLRLEEFVYSRREVGTINRPLMANPVR